MQNRQKISFKYLNLLRKLSIFFCFIGFNLLDFKVKAKSWLNIKIQGYTGTHSATKTSFFNLFGIYGFENSF